MSQNELPSRSFRAFRISIARARGASPLPNAAWISQYPLQKLWGRPPACSGLLGRLLRCGFSGESGATGPAQAESLPHNLCRIPRLAKSMRHWARGLPRPHSCGRLALVSGAREAPYSPRLGLSIRSSNRTLTVSPASFPMAWRILVLTGSLCVPSPIAINELRNG